MVGSNDEGAFIPESPRMATTTLLVRSRRWLLSIPWAEHIYSSSCCSSSSNRRLLKAILRASQPTPMLWDMAAAYMLNSWNLLLPRSQSLLLPRSIEPSRSQPLPPRSIASASPERQARPIGVPAVVTPEPEGPMMALAPSSQRLLPPHLSGCLGLRSQKLIPSRCNCMHVCSTTKAGCRTI